MRDQRLWTWHIGAGAVILVLLGLHMTVMHLDAVVRVFNPQPGEPIAWANVVARGKSAFFLVTYVLLLGAALFHGFYGLRNILFELNPARRPKKALNGAAAGRRPGALRGRHVGGLGGIHRGARRLTGGDEPWQTRPPRPTSSFASAGSTRPPTPSRTGRTTASRRRPA